MWELHYSFLRNLFFWFLVCIDINQVHISLHFVDKFLLQIVVLKSQIFKINRINTFFAVSASMMNSVQQSLYWRIKKKNYLWMAGLHYFIQIKFFVLIVVFQWHQFCLIKIDYKNFEVLHQTSFHNYNFLLRVLRYYFSLKSLFEEIFL